MTGGAMTLALKVSITSDVLAVIGTGLCLTSFSSNMVSSPIFIYDSTSLVGFRVGATISKLWRGFGFYFLTIV